MPLTVATLNIKFSLNEKRVLEDLERAADAGVDLIGLQECSTGDHRKAIERLKGFNAFHPARGGGKPIPILWRTDRLKKLDSRTMATLKVPPLLDGGPGKGDTAKAINMVKLRDRESGQNIILLNMHGLAGVQGPNGVNRNPERAKRVSYFMKQMDDLYQVGTKMKPKGIVFTTGDLNVDYRVDSRERDKNFPYKTFDRLNIWPSYRAFGMPKGGTHEAKPGEAMGNRLIDYVAHERKKKLKVIKQRIVRGFNTDHHMLAVDYNIGKSALPVDRDPDPDDKPLPPEDIEEEPIPEDDRPPEENPPHFC